MPRYDYECKCGNKVELARTIDHRNDIVKCSRCGSNMIKVISKPPALLGFDKYGRSNS